MTTINKFYWDKDTLATFKEDARWLGYGDLKWEVEFFVTNDCDLEEGETIDMLTMDLLNQVLED